MNFYTLIIGFIVIGMFGIGLGAFAVDLNRNYNANLSEKFFAEANEINSTRYLIQNSSLYSHGVDVSGGQTDIDVFKASVGGLNVVSKAPGEFMKIVSNMFNFLGLLHPDLQGAVIGLMVVTVVFSILYAFFKVKI